MFGMQCFPRRSMVSGPIKKININSQMRRILSGHGYDLVPLSKEK